MNTQEQREKLAVMQEHLEKELSSIGHRIPNSNDWMVLPDEGDGSKADAVDNADITEDFEEKIAVLKVLEKQYQQILEALKALEDGTYGVCRVCNTKIPEKRIAIDPSVLTCVEHAR